MMSHGVTAFRLGLETGDILGSKKIMLSLALWEM